MQDIFQTRHKEAMKSTPESTAADFPTKHYAMLILAAVVGGIAAYTIPLPAILVFPLVSYIAFRFFCGI
jgi:hypothetical protein